MVSCQNAQRGTEWTCASCVIANAASRMPGIAKIFVCSRFRAQTFPEDAVVADRMSMRLVDTYRAPNTNRMRSGRSGILYMRLRIVRYTGLFHFHFEIRKAVESYLRKRNCSV